MQLQIGGFRFEFEATSVEFAERKQVASRRWAARARRGRPARLEDLGRGRQRLDLRGSIPVLVGDERQALDALHIKAGLSAGAGADVAPEPLELLQIDGDTATLAGLWVVTRIETVERALRTTDGIPAAIDFKIALEEYHP